MSKYSPLGKHLQNQTAETVLLSFAEIEYIVGAKLPQSAHVHHQWWENDALTHVQAKAWLGAGFRTEDVDLAGKQLVFKRIGLAHGSSGMREPQREFKHNAGKSEPRRHPLFGAMKGLFTVEPGYDLTQPAMPEWADLLDEKYGPEKAE